MSVSDAQKRANAKWSKENMVTVTARITKQLADEFERACAELGYTKSGVLKQAIRNVIIVARESRERE